MLIRLSLPTNISGLRRQNFVSFGDSYIHRARTLSDTKLVLEISGFISSGNAYQLQD